MAEAKKGKDLEVEAEGGELILRSDNGDIAIIPKAHASKVEIMLKSKEDHSEALEELIMGLPSEAAVAADGSYVEKDDPPSNILDEVTVYSTKSHNEEVMKLKTNTEKYKANLEDRKSVV